MTVKTARSLRNVFISGVLIVLVAACAKPTPEVREIAREVTVVVQQTVAVHQTVNVPITVEVLLPQTVIVQQTVSIRETVVVASTVVVTATPEPASTRLPTVITTKAPQPPPLLAAATNPPRTRNLEVTFTNPHYECQKGYWEWEQVKGITEQVWGYRSFQADMYIKNQGQTPVEPPWKPRRWIITDGKNDVVSDLAVAMGQTGRWVFSSASDSTGSECRLDFPRLSTGVQPVGKGCGIRVGRADIPSGIRPWAVWQ